MAGLPRAGAKSKPHHYKQLRKNEGHSENMCFNGKTVRRFQTKKNSSIHQTTPWNTWPVNAAIDDGPCNQEEMNCRKIEKSIQVETVGTLQY